MHELLLVPRQVVQRQDDGNCANFWLAMSFGLST